MLRGDGTGHMGAGSGMGCRAGFGMHRYPVAGAGRGRGRGYRRLCVCGLPGRVHNGVDTYEYGAEDASVVNEKEALKKHAAFLEKHLSRVRKRLNSLEEAE